MSHDNCVTCGGNWRIVACNLATGVERAVLHPTSFDFEKSLNKLDGQGTLNLVTREVLPRDIWPHLTSIYFLRIGGPDATPYEPIVEWGAYVEKFAASDNNSTSVGLKSIEEYLLHRNIRRRLNYDQQGQTNIAASLVNYARNEATPSGIPLRGVADTSFITRDRTYEAWDRKNVGDAIEDLSEVINGPDWEVSHSRSDRGAWTTTLTFRDHVGGNRDVLLRSDYEASGYSLEVDAANHATVVDAIGAGEKADMLIETAVDELEFYPEFDEAPAWKDVERRSVLREHAEGYLEDYREPVAVPAITVPGLETPIPNDVRLGDVVDVETNFGAVSYHGPIRITSISWAVKADEPETRTYDGTPLTRASQSVLNQRPDDMCEECD